MKPRLERLADPFVCHLCGQELPQGGRCNSGIHQGLDNPNGWDGVAVRLSESPFDEVYVPYET